MRMMASNVNLHLGQLRPTSNRGAPLSIVPSKQPIQLHPKPPSPRRRLPSDQNHRVCFLFGCLTCPPTRAPVSSLRYFRRADTRTWYLGSRAPSVILISRMGPLLGLVSLGAQTRSSRAGKVATKHGLHEGSEDDVGTPVIIVSSAQTALRLVQHT